jgi:hypothetical protein
MEGPKPSQQGDLDLKQVQEVQLSYDKAKEAAAPTKSPFSYG